MNPVAARYSRALHQFVMRHFTRPEAVDAVALETYKRLCRRPSMLLVKDPRGALYGIATNVVIGQHGGDRATQTDDAASVLPGEADQRLELQRQIDIGLAELHPMDAAALLAEKRDGMHQADIAHRLGIPQNLVERCVTRAKASLRTRAWRA